MRLGAISPSPICRYWRGSPRDGRRARLKWHETGRKSIPNDVTISLPYALRVINAFLVQSALEAPAW